MEISRADVVALPKAELHLHIEGTLEPELAMGLAARNRVELPYADAATLRRAFEFTDLDSFLAVYYECMAALRTAEDFRDLAAAYLARARADGVVHVEMFFDPQVHMERGVALGEVVQGLVAAGRESAATGGPSVALIPCVVRHLGPAAALQALEALADHREHIIGLGMDSTEVGHPPSDFAEVFAAAGDLGLHRVVHAGEEGPAAYVWEALDLGAERIDHGIRAVEDPALLRRLAADRIPLTLCPLSNVRLRCVSDLAAHPLPRLLDAGVVATINSDDPAYFGGYVADNYLAVAEALDLDEATVSGLAASSLTAAFEWTQSQKPE